MPIDEMPAVSAHSASCRTKPVVGVGRAGTDDRVGGMEIGRLEADVGSRQE